MSKIKSTPLIFVHNAGALGDFVASLGSLKYGIEQFYSHGESFKLMCQPIFMPLVQFMPQSDIFDIGKGEVKITEPHAMVIFNETIKMPNGDVAARIHPMRMGLWDYASIKFFNRIFSADKISYPRLKLHSVSLNGHNLPDKYCVIVVNHSAANRQILPIELNKISAYCAQLGIIPVFLGKTSVDFKTENVRYLKHDDVDLSMGVDLVNKTSIMEAAKIMSCSEFVLGVDGGLLHLAGMTKAKIVAGYTSVAPELRMPIRDGIIGKDVFPVVPKSDCRFCSNTTQLEGFNFNNCPCPDNVANEPPKCVKELTFENYKISIDKALNI